MSKNYYWKSENYKVLDYCDIPQEVTWEVEGRRYLSRAVKIEKTEGGERLTCVVGTVTAQEYENYLKGILCIREMYEEVLADPVFVHLSGEEESTSPVVLKDLDQSLPDSPDMVFDPWYLDE